MAQWIKSFEGYHVNGNFIEIIYLEEIYEPLALRFHIIAEMQNGNKHLIDMWESRETAEKSYENIMRILNG